MNVRADPIGYLATLFVCSALTGCAGLFAHKSGPFWSTAELGGAAPPSGMLAALLAYHPAPRLPLPEELQAVDATSPIRLERVLGQSDMLHPDVSLVAFSPDGRRLISLGRDSDLRIWDPVTRAPLGAFAGCAESNWGSALTISPDGKLAANATTGGRICVRDLADGHVVRTWKAHAAPILALAFTSSGELLSFAYQQEIWAETSISPIREAREAGGELRRWRVDSDAAIGELRLGPASVVRFSSDGSLVVARDLQGTLHAWDGGGRALWTGKTNVYRFAFVDQDRQLLLVESRRIHIVDARTGGELGDLTPTSSTRKLFWRPGESDTSTWSDCIAVMPDGRHAITALHDDPFLFVWDLAARREVEHPHGRNFPACAGAFSPDGTLLATADGGFHVVRLWDPAAHLPLPDRNVYQLAISSDGRRAISLGGDETVRLWDLDRGAEVARRRLTDGTSVALSAAGDRMLLGFENGWARLYDVASGAELWSLAGRAGSGAWKLSPDGRLAVTSSYKEGLAVHDVTTTKELWRVPLGDYTSAVAAFSPDGRLLAHVDRDQRLTIRTAREGREVRRLGEAIRHWSLGFSPDGRYLLVDEGAIVILELAGGKEIRRIPYPAGYVALGRGGLLAFARRETGRAIELSRLEDGAPLGRITLGPRFGVVQSLAIAADGTRLLVGTDRGLTLVFAMTPMIGN
jgi:WD40 repeat protein